MDIREKLVELIGCAPFSPVQGVFRTIAERFSSEFIYRIADHLIANGVTVQEWRPVSELPKRNGEIVLVYYEYFRYGEYNRLFRTIGLGYALDGEWSRFINGESGWHRLKILAWMPLPQPPKGE